MGVHGVVLYVEGNTGGGVGVGDTIRLYIPL